VGRHRRRQTTDAARSSIGGSLRKRFTRGRHHPENRCGLVTCRRPVPRSRVTSARRASTSRGSTSTAASTFRARGLKPGLKDGDFLKPEAIADTYWHLAHQDPSARTMELEVRPFKEKF